MAEAALIGLATDSAKGLVQLLAGRAMNEIDLAWGFKDQLQILNKKFEYIQAFLEDAGNSKFTEKSRLVNLFVQKVKDAAYLADDVMDEYAIEIFQRKMELKTRRRKFRNLLTPSSSNPVFFRFRMAHKVKEILSLFDEIDKDAKKIGLRPVDVAAKAQTDTYKYDNHLGETRQHAGASASEFVGREDDQAKLLDVICSPTNETRDLYTVAVVGMGGQGKTTLARRLFDDERVHAHFSKEKIWISVSENFTINRFLNEMVESVTSSKLELANTDAIIRKLEEKLKGKRMLLVLDDVWNDNQDSWGSLKHSLLRIGTAPGSVILITTRSNDVANAARAAFKHKLNGLSEDESWSLLHQIVLSNSIRTINSSLEEVGKRIVKKCSGVPLAIKVIGGLLESKQYIHEWESIEKSELWDSQHGQNQILPSLLLSFNHLPFPSLKQCFAYYGVLFKGCYMEKRELIGFWLSQGYLCTDKRKNLATEEIGEEYLNILLCNSLLEECVPKGSQNICYQMHDLVFDLAVYVSGSDLIREVKDLHDKVDCRHLVLESVENNGAPDFPPEKALSKLRTIYFVGNVRWDLLTHTKFLRTLLIVGKGIVELPSDIELLKHLRHLDVSHNPISTLPNSIGKLYQLQTLILQGCKNMKTVPKILYKLVNLRYISTTAPMFAWKGLKQLTTLQSLPSLSLNDDVKGWSIDELGYLHELRDEINIMGLECVKDKENARKAGLAGKPNVTKLNLSWTEGRSDAICDEDVLEGLEPHKNITSLEVRNFNGVKFPTWIAEMAVVTEASRGNRTRLNNLTVVKLLNCSGCETLPKLGQLPSLKCLILTGLDVELIGSEFYGGGDLQMQGVPFESLRELEISEFGRLTEWMEPPEAAFPCLETLRIRDCWELESVPALGTKSIISLQLEGLYNVESLDIIKYNSGLTSLIMIELTEIESLPQELANCTKLQILDISNLHKLTSLPRGLESLVNLQSLSVVLCHDLNFIMDDLLHVSSSLREFRIGGCPSLRKIPSSLEECTSLETLFIIKCPLIESSPTNISKLRRLSTLMVCYNSAEHLRSVLEAAQYLPLLHMLGIEGFHDEKEMGEYFSDMIPFLCLPSLRILLLHGHPNIKTLPQQLGLLTQLTYLYVWNFDDLEEIPDWICDLSSLVALILEDCKKLKRIPYKDYLKRLTYLTIKNCPMLVEKYNKEEGPEWHNISHINFIEIDEIKIQDL